LALIATSREFRNAMAANRQAFVRARLMLATGDLSFSGDSVISTHRNVLSLGLLAACGHVHAVNPATCNTTDAYCIGAFSAPFAEPTIGSTVTSERCITEPSGRKVCKPAAGTLVTLYDGRFLYINALEGSENVQVFPAQNDIVAASENSQTRVMSISPTGAVTWAIPSPADGGAGSQVFEPTPIVPGGAATGTMSATHSLFCSDVAQLADGRILAVGGSAFYSEPVVELEGTKNGRIFNPQNNTWSETASMIWGRWYPTAITLANSDVFVASGLTKLIKPVYPTAPLQSGRNVVQTETFSAGCATWRDNGGMAQRSLPLYPRLHLLPNGHVFYNAAGQAFNPAGEGYDQALWNITGTYDPATKAWSDVSYAGFPFQMNAHGAAQLSSALNPTNPQQAQLLLNTLIGLTYNTPDSLIAALTPLFGLVDRGVVERAIGSGMRGSTFSIMLPLKPDAYGQYKRADFLTAGGTATAVAATTPGSYLPTFASRIDSMDLSSGSMRYSSQLTGPIKEMRWFSTGILMPDGSVMAFSGGNRDHLFAPGTEGAVRQAERFDPVSRTWKRIAIASQARTYHNAALLMPDGRVLVGGHGPAPTGYAQHTDLSGLGTAPNDGHDPSFEIYSPPYAFRTDRPVIVSSGTQPRALDRGDVHTISTPQAALIDGVVLMRNTDITHLVDADQRAVQLRIVSRGADSVKVQIPADAAVLPSGYYMLFISKTDADGTVVPSKSAPIRINAPITFCNAGG
jgi:hypothetical protein